MKIYSNYSGNIFVQTAMVAADLARQNVEVVIMDEAARNEAGFKAKHLTGKFPLLELENGELVFESSAICQHFGRIGGLNGDSAFEAAKVDEWIAFTQCNIWPATMPVAMAVFGRVETKPEDFTKAVNKLKNHAKTLNNYLDGKHFLAGEKLSVADVICACALIMSF